MRPLTEVVQTLQKSKSSNWKMLETNIFELDSTEISMNLAKTVLTTDLDYLLS